MAEAIFGLIGVIVGGLVSGGAAFFMERRRERRQLLAAIRTVRYELFDHHKQWGAVAGALVRGAGPAELPDVTTGRDMAWREHQPLLAAHLPADAWDAVAVAYGMNMQIDTLRTYGLPDGKSDAWRRQRGAELASGRMNMVERAEDQLSKVEAVIDRPDTPWGRWSHWKRRRAAAKPMNLVDTARYWDFLGGRRDSPPSRPNPR